MSSCLWDVHDDVLVTAGDEEDQSDFIYFSPCERQYLLEHIIESQIREAVHLKKV